MTIKEVVSVYDTPNRYNLSTKDSDQRFRFSQNYFYFSISNAFKLTHSNFKDAKKQNKNIIYEIGTTQGPYWWLGDLNKDYPNLIHMFDLIHQQQPKLFKLTNTKKAVIHIDQTLEGFPLLDSINKKDYYRSIHNKIDQYNINPEQIIYSTSNLIENKKYQMWCNANNIKKRMRIVDQMFFAEMSRGHHFFQSTKSGSEVTVDEHLDFKNNNHVKTFSCLNRVIRQHRIALLAMLNYYDLIEGSELSFDVYDNHYLDTKTFKNHNAFNKTNLDNIKSKVPLTVDVSDFTVNKAQHFLKSTYLNTWYSIITETYFQDHYKDSVFFSEKIFKPMRAMHPFILVCQPHALKTLKTFGFKTFSDFWDESYDSIEDPVQRLDAICKLASSLNKKSKSEWLSMYSDMRSVLEHNYEHLTNTQWVNYDSVLKDLYNV